MLKKSLFILFVFVASSMNAMVSYNMVPYNEAHKNNAALLGASCDGSLAVVQDLLLKGAADVNTQDNEGNTPLLLAISNNNIDIVEALIAAGAEVDCLDEETRLFHGCADIAQQLEHEIRLLDQHQYCCIIQ